jgi:hypothetical protein
MLKTWEPVLDEFADIPGATSLGLEALRQIRDSWLAIGFGRLVGRVPPIVGTGDEL